MVDWFQNIAFLEEGCEKALQNKYLSNYTVCNFFLLHSSLGFFSQSYNIICIKNYDNIIQTKPYTELRFFFAYYNYLKSIIESNYMLFKLECYTNTFTSIFSFFINLYTQCKKKLLSIIYCMCQCVSLLFKIKFLLHIKCVRSINIK